MKGTRGAVEVRRAGIIAGLIALVTLLALPLKAFAERMLVCWANHRGSEGTVHVGTTALAELRGWEVTELMEPIDDTTLNDTARTYQSGLNSWSGSASAFWDETDTTGQEALTIGASVTLKFYPEGASSGDQYYSGTALVTGIARRGAIQGMVEVDFTFQGTGALAESTVSP